MEVVSLGELKNQFVDGEFTFPREILVGGVKYKFKNSSSYSMEDVLFKSYKTMMVYSTAYREQAADAGLDQNIIFLWGLDEGTYKILPYDVRTMSIARLGAEAITEKVDNGGNVNIPKDKIIGDVVEVIITSLPGSNPMKGKVDTGADVSSIHAEDWEVKNGEVSFNCPELSENRISLPVIEKQAIKSSNGDTEYRPVIELSIKINEMQLTNVMFNLNDRGTMKYPMLVGQNILECGGFMIDPTINDPDAVVEDFEIDWEMVQEEFKDDIVLEAKDKDKREYIINIIDRIKAEIETDK